MTILFVCCFLPGAFRLLFTLRSFSVGGLSPYRFLTLFLLSLRTFMWCFAVFAEYGNCYKTKFLV